MEKYRRGSGLEIDVDLEQESREWIVQRIAWLVLTALLAAVALGLFGRGGPLSTSQVRSADGATQVDYQRFIRNHSADTLRISALARDDSVRVRMDSRYARHIEMEVITPQPDRVVSEGDAIMFVFNARPSTRLEAEISFHPETIGGLNGWISVDGGPRLPFRQFVYP